MYQISLPIQIHCESCGYDNLGIPKDVLKDKKILIDCVKCGQLIVSPKPRLPPVVKKMEKAECQITQLVSIDGDYDIVTITKNLWMCRECGLVWQMRGRS